ncbi:MAG: tRNA guanosine(34) transglycosylase Tgt [Phycisphaeraceae bacterium]
MHPVTYELIREDTNTRARLGRVTTPHGSYDTPAFMPVGTRASVKGLSPQQVEATGAQIILGNTYHLMLRPGSDLIDRMGGLHEWMRWQHPILTDSGGFQVFSLSDINRINDDGVTFKSHLDGSVIELTPERSMQVQNELGADIIMAFDDCPPSMDEASEKSSQECAEQKDAESCQARASRHAVSVEDYGTRVKQANERTVRWLERCVKAHRRKTEQGLFGIVQGGTDLDARSWCVEQITQHDLPGYAIGGVAVGERYDQIKQVVEHTAPLLPADRPRYLMGVGYERDILMAVQAGVDMFDCVLPTRNGRNACAFTPTGQVRLRNARFAEDHGVIDPGCDCPACGGGFSRSYLRHLFVSGEMLGPILVSAHNLRHFQRFLLDIRQAIAHNDWSLIPRRWPVAV